MTLSLSGDTAATITAIGTLITSVGTAVVGWMGVLQSRRSKENSKKLDANTELTKATAVKVEEVHSQVANGSGSFPTIKP